MAMLTDAAAMMDEVGATTTEVAAAMTEVATTTMEAEGVVMSVGTERTAQSPQTQQGSAKKKRVAGSEAAVVKAQEKAKEVLLTLAHVDDLTVVELHAYLVHIKKQPPSGVTKVLSTKNTRGEMAAELTRVLKLAGGSWKFRK